MAQVQSQILHEDIKYNKNLKYKVLTMVKPGCIPARMASI